MFTWRDVITGALELNGERWDDIEFTPFNEDELSMSSNPVDAENNYNPPSEAAWTEKYVYTVFLDWEYNLYLITPYLRNPPSSS